MNKLKYFFIILVLGVSVFTHFYRIDQTFIFNNDEGRDALIAFRMIQTKTPVLLGPETSVGNMYLGPFYYYLMVPSLLLFGLNPVGPAMMVALLGVLTTLGIIYLGKKWGNTWSGIVAGLFYALNPVMLHYSRSSWNPNVVPFFSLLLLINWSIKSKWSPLIFGILSGIIFQLHYVALVLPGLLFLQETWQLYKNRQFNTFPKYLLTIITGFILATSPFWLFEARHRFINTRALGTYISEKGSESVTVYPKYLTRVMTNSQTVIRGIIGSKSESQSGLSLPIVILSGVILLVYCVSCRNILSFILLGSILITSLLKENIYVHYLSFLFPVISLIIGLSLTSKKWLLAGATAILLIFLARPIFLDLKYNLYEVVSSQTIRAQNVADYIVKESNGAPYNIVNSSTSSSSTILYYLAISKNPPKNTDQSLVYVICESALCKDDILTATDLFVNGPSHPTLIDFLGYAPNLYSSEPRIMIKNKWVTYEIYIATVQR